MEKVRPWCGQPSDRGRLKNRNRLAYLPPAFAPVGSERGDDVLNVVTGSVERVRIVRTSRIAHKALVVLVLQMTDDTEPAVSVTQRHRIELQLQLN